MCDPKDTIDKWLSLEKKKKWNLNETTAVCFGNGENDLLMKGYLFSSYLGEATAHLSFTTREHHILKLS